MSTTQGQELEGPSAYTKKALNAYDFAVLGIAFRFIWKCPTELFIEHYDKHVSANHLDIGVGTGYFLDNCLFPSSSPRVMLMDINQGALDFAAKRIKRYNPETYRHSVLDPIQIHLSKFDSVGINNVLQCVPGSIESKSVAFDYLKAHMNPGAVIFGATLLQGGVPRNWFAKHLMNFYNKKGIFSNEADHLDGLSTELKKRFKRVSIEVVGCAALFAGCV